MNYLGWVWKIFFRSFF